MANAKDLAAKIITRFHRLVYDISGGKLAGSGMGMPVLKLTTIGRHSGEERITMLTTPLIEGDDVVIVASYGGDDRHPAWYLNLAADPDVEIELDDQRKPMRARVAEGDERTELWDKLTVAHDNYAGYQRRTDREIPVVVLEPRA